MSISSTQKFFLHNIPHKVCKEFFVQVYKQEMHSYFSPNWIARSPKSRYPLKRSANFCPIGYPAIKNTFK